MTNKKPVSAAVIGLGSMGLGIAKSMANRYVHKTDINPIGGLPGSVAPRGGVPRENDHDSRN